MSCEVNYSHVSALNIFAIKSYGCAILVDTQLSVDQGYVKIKHLNYNGYVCDDDFTELDAQVACKVGGYNRGIGICCYGWGHSSGPIGHVFSVTDMHIMVYILPVAGNI